MNIVRFQHVLVAVVLISAGAVNTFAAMEGQKEESRILSDKWYLSAGTSISDFNTEAAVGFGSVLGTIIRLESTLELDEDRDLFRFNGAYQFNSRHQIDFTITDVDRNSSHILDETITIGDEGEEITYEIGGRLDTEFNSLSAKVFYKYSFINDGDVQAGIGVGLSIFDYELILDGMALVDDGTGGQVLEARRVDEDVVAPVPSMLMFVHKAFTKKFIFRATAGFFNLDVSDYEGRLIESRLTLDYFFNKHIGIGGGFESSDIQFRDTGGNPLLVNVETDSIVFYVGGTF